MGVGSLLKRFDIYRRVPTDLTKATLPGAVVSFVCLSLIMFLVVSELVAFLSGSTNSEMVVDASRGLEHLKIKVNLTLPYMPCDALTFHTHDAMGRAGGKQRAVFEDFVQFAENNARIVGCTIAGQLTVTKVPGNIVIATRNKEEGEDPDMAHYIHSLSFADTHDHEHHYDDHDEDEELDMVDEMSVALKSQLFRALDGVSKHINTTSGSQTPTTYEYYIHIVPTVIERADGTFKHSYQMTYNFNDRDTAEHEDPSVFFKYEISPISVKVKHEYGSLAHLLVQLCGIIGGIMTVAGMVAALTSNIHEKIELKKLQ